MSTPNKNCCPKCGAKEVDFDHPRTKYECGSTDLDGRPGTFHQTEKCKGACKDAE